MITVDGRNLTLADVEAVARHRAPVGLGTGEVRERIERSVRFKEELVEMGVPMYGVTTNVSDSVHVQIARDRTAVLQRNLMHKLGYSTDAYLPKAYARTVMLLRANTLARGQSAVRPVIIETLLACLDAGIASCIPEEGSVGASGDLVPLSYVGATICGERNV